MINYIIPLIGCMQPMFDYVLTLVIALAFVATVPCVIRGIVKFYV